jgi:hypothetical protein
MAVVPALNPRHFGRATERFLTGTEQGATVSVQTQPQDTHKKWSLT